MDAALLENVFKQCFKVNRIAREEVHLFASANNEIPVASVIGIEISISFFYFENYGYECLFYYQNTDNKSNFEDQLINKLKDVINRLPATNTREVDYFLFLLTQSDYFNGYYEGIITENYFFNKVLPTFDFNYFNTLKVGV
ncbi:hypothetical protein [Rummeliibacillus pycnus]|uniref:hypothetical protein n=1 Tax=Rummeliibacillus pycnus TaxID=101070 RepID=UPI003D29349C